MSVPSAVPTAPPAEAEPVSPHGALACLPKVETGFIGIGEQKAATTWVAEALRAHPDCHMPAQKEMPHDTPLFEPGPDAARLSRQRDKVRRGVIRCVRAAPSPSRLRREAWKLRFARAKLASAADPSDEAYGRRLNPNTRFLFIMRDPLEGLWPGVRFASRSGTLSGAARAAAISKEFEAALADQSNRGSLLTDYKRTIEALDRVVPPATWDKGRKALAPIYDYLEERFGERVPPAWRQSRNG